MNFIQEYFKEAQQIMNQLDCSGLEKIVALIAEIRSQGGRIFFLGVGGSAANASHAVNDFRKICGIECYTPTDNVSELTARINDEGWDSAYVQWLQVSRLNSKDMLFIFSVGGGNVEKKISTNLVKALAYGKQVHAKICGVVGPNGGATAQMADVCVKIPAARRESVTPHTEAFQAVIWHCMVSHPKLKMNEMKWESTLK